MSRIFLVPFPRTRKRPIAFGAFRHVDLRSRRLIRRTSVSLFLQSRQIDVHDTIDASKKHPLASPKEISRKKGYILISSFLPFRAACLADLI